MYSENDITKIDFRTFIVSREEMFFGTRGASPEVISSNIAQGALILGCSNCHISKNINWWVISSTEDWLSLPNISAVNSKNAFEAFHAFPEAGQNWHREESLGFIFSSAFATSSNGLPFDLLKGTVRDRIEFEKILKLYPKANRIIAFKFQKQA